MKNRFSFNLTFAWLLKYIYFEDLYSVREHAFIARFVLTARVNTDKDIET